MKFVSALDLPTAPAQVWKSLSTEKEMVITFF